MAQVAQNEKGKYVMDCGIFVSLIVFDANPPPFAHPQSFHPLYPKALHTPLPTALLLLLQLSPPFLSLAISSAFRDSHPFLASSKSPSENATRSVLEYGFVVVVAGGSTLSGSVSTAVLVGTRNVVRSTRQSDRHCVDFELLRDISESDYLGEAERFGG
jgi:hypothetical protein